MCYERDSHESSLRVYSTVRFGISLMCQRFRGFLASNTFSYKSMLHPNTIFHIFMNRHKLCRLYNAPFPHSSRWRQWQMSPKLSWNTCSTVVASSNNQWFSINSKRWRKVMNQSWHDSLGLSYLLFFEGHAMVREQHIQAVQKSISASLWTTVVSALLYRAISLRLVNRSSD